MRLGVTRLAGQVGALSDSEAVLLVDDRQSQTVEPDALLNQCVGTDEECDRTAFDEREKLTALFCAGAAGEERHRWPFGLVESSKKTLEVVEVLLCQDLGRRHNGDLKTGTHGQERDGGRNRGL